MQLMSEERGKRVYLGNDMETWYEQRAEVKMQTWPVLERQFDLPRSEEDAEACRLATMRCQLSMRSWFMDNDEFDPIGEMEVSASADTYTREGLARLKFDPEEFEPQSLYRLIVVSQYYWPPAPVDPDPADPTPPPRASDFRGDPKA